MCTSVFLKSTASEMYCIGQHTTFSPSQCYYNFIHYHFLLIVTFNIPNFQGKTENSTLIKISFFKKLL